MCADRPAVEPGGLPFVELVDPSWLRPQWVEKLPVDWARTHQVLPVEKDGVLYALAAGPSAAARAHELSLLLGRDLFPLLSTPEQVRRAIDLCYSMREAPAINAEPISGVRQIESKAEDLLRVGEDAPVAQYVSALLLDALRRRASDIHLEPFESHLQIRFRIDGFLYAQPQPPRTIEDALVSRIKVMARLDVAERRLPQDGMARVRIGEREFDVRVSTIPVAEGERVVLRLLNPESLLRPLEQLGMPKRIEEDFRRALREPHGVILVTGPTGSGKTTTLYAALQAIDTARLNVLTIEDPIEYQIPNVSQMQVRPKIGLTFAQGLRHILRQDPDVILVGEIRDAETAEIAVRAALTGHLVFSTLHTNDAVSAVARLADMGVPTYLLATALRGCMAQRLVRRLCPNCRRESRATPEELQLLGRRAAEVADRPIWRPGSCSSCMGGYLDRIGIYEWVAFGQDWESAIRMGHNVESLRRQARSRGIPSLADDGMEKVLSGITSLDEFFRALGGSHTPDLA
ncbi:MAG: GspE/PulE family protein [Kiritimatiellae bacterium]|nr:GspE/PulE family protein [Kiritimatiellia bacterium]MDW8458954.1 GspE/PulE family protein [Verrucomicrobiota bacterium]